jgi:hypothetical protein
MMCGGKRVFNFFSLIAGPSREQLPHQPKRKIISTHHTSLKLRAEIFDSTLPQTSQCLEPR